VPVPLSKKEDMVLGRVHPPKSLEEHHDKSGVGETSNSFHREEDPAEGEAHGKRGGEAHQAKTKADRVKAYRKANKEYGEC